MEFVTLPYRMGTVIVNIWERRPLAGLMIAAVLTVLVASSVTVSAFADDRPVCTGARPNDDTCYRRPHKVAVGATAGVQGIRWRNWGGRRALGFGKLVGSHVGRRRAKVVFSSRRPCVLADGTNVFVYHRLTVRWGGHWRHRARQRWVDC